MVFHNQVILNIHASYEARSMRLERLSITLFIQLNDGSICRPVKINNAALTTLERDISQI